MTRLRISSLLSMPPLRKRQTRPVLEGLEDRLLLYSTLGAQWVHGQRITYSFVPDGTSIGGTPSALFQTLNAKFATSTWQQQFQKAAAAWQVVANVNLVQVSDDGSPLGVDGNQQGDSRFGDIRFSAIPQAPGIMSVCFLPPPINGGSDAGDIVMNSSTNWQINTGYDLQTVAIHEIGHALGLGHSQITAACMYAAYNGVKQSLASDDVNGIRSVWQAPQPDQFNSNGASNALFTRAANITSYIDANAQVSIPSLRLHATGQSEWFSITVPATSTGTMVVKMQSSGLSSLGPRVSVFTTALGLLGQSGSVNYGDTVSVSISGVQPGQTYLVRASANPGGTLIGGFGLQVNFGSQYQPPIPPPDTAVAQQPDQPGGVMNAHKVMVGNHSGYGEAFTTTGTDYPVATYPGASPGSPTGLLPVSGLPPVYEGVLMFASSAEPDLVASSTTATAGQTNAALGLETAAPAESLQPEVCQAVDQALASWRPTGSLLSLDV